MLDVTEIDRAEEARQDHWLRVGTAVAAILVALMVASQIQLSMSDHGHASWRIFLWQLSGWSFGPFLVVRILKIGASLHHPSERTASWRQGVRLLGWIAWHLVAVAGVFWGLQPYVPVEIYPFKEALFRTLASWTHVDLLVCGFGVAIGYGIEGYRQARRSEVRQSRLEAELARAQLETLRLQIQPHFLFNALNSISALMRRRKSEQAHQMLLGLSDLLRVTLERSAASHQPLRAELDYLRVYVKLQQLRFSDRLQVNWDVEECLLDEPVPSLLLQPLVENAIRHGIAPRAAQGRIWVRAQVDAERLKLIVEDDGLGLADGFDLERDAGIGLGNSLSRLRQLYGQDFEFVVREGRDGRTVAAIGLPLDRNSPEITSRAMVG